MDARAAPTSSEIGSLCGKQNRRYTNQPSDSTVEEPTVSPDAAAPQKRFVRGVTATPDE